MFWRVATLASLMAILTLCASPLSAGTWSAPSCELTAKERYTYYEISGKDVDDLRREMNLRGTVGEDGRVYSALTSWDINFAYDIARDGSGYRVKSATTNVDIEYRLPRVGTSWTDPGLNLVWGRYLERLQQHEFGHKNLAVQAASEINELLASLPAFPTADALAAEITKVTDEKFRVLKEKQVGYDDETRHGETQGAVLPGHGTHLAGA
jgi:predicted secreted Zn-dependent protease